MRSRYLKFEGLMLLHTITGQTEGGTNSFAEKYIFPVAKGCLSANPLRHYRISG